MRNRLSVICIGCLLSSAVSAEDQPIGVGINTFFDLIAEGPAATEKRAYVEQVFADQSCILEVAHFEEQLMKDGYAVREGHIERVFVSDPALINEGSMDEAILNLSISAMFQDGVLEIAGRSPQSIKSNGKGCA